MLLPRRCPALLTFSAFALSLAVSFAPLRAQQRLAVEGEHGMVVSVQAMASEAGNEILHKGGNAIDAAVATGLALEVVYPFAGNLGGGGFMLIHTADGKDVAIDYRETAPAAATRDMYLDKNGDPIKGPGSSTVGWRASGVPGTVAGFALALEKYGSHKVTWADVVEPARRLAAEGQIVTQYNALRLKLSASRLEKFAETKRVYLNGGEQLPPGALWRQPDLAATLTRLQKEGPREFYTGQTAKLIADAMAKNGGTITLDDLAHYKAAERTPLRATYRGYEIVTMPPPSSGGVALIQMLEMLEPHDVGALGYNSSAKYHLFVEVMRRAYRDRAEYLGDPDYVKVPVAGLTDREYVAGLMKSFDPNKATPSAGLAPGKPAGMEPRGGAARPASLYYNPLFSESTQTTHFCVVDAAGNAVTNTYTLNGGYGSGVTIPGTGLLMNNEMDDFTSKPGVPNAYKLIQGEANAIQPGKRPLSSMTPTFVFKDGKLFLATGSPGGSTIINTVLLVVTNVIDHQMQVAQAVDAPRINHQWMPDVINYEPYGLSEDVIAALKAKGHQVSTRNLYDPDTRGIPTVEFYQGDAESIAVDPVTHHFQGAPDPRKPDSKAVGW